MPIIIADTNLLTEERAMISPGDPGSHPLRRAPTTGNTLLVVAVSWNQHQLDELSN